MILRKTTFNSDYSLGLSSPTGLVCPITLSCTNPWLQPTTNSCNIALLCTINIAPSRYKSRTRQTITPTNPQRPKQTP